MMSDSQQKILIIRLSSIGDILLTTPFIRQVRKKYPKAQIDFVVKTEYSELLEYNPNINNLIKFESATGTKGLKKLKKSLNENEYEYIFDLHNNIRSNYLRRGLRGKKKHQIKKNKVIQFLYVKFKINRYPDTIPIAERYLNVGKAAGVEDDGRGLEVFWEKEIEDSIDQILEKNGLIQNETFFTVAPGAGLYTKRWPIEYYKIFIEDIIENHKSKVLVLGNDNDREQGNSLNDLNDVIDLTGKLSLLQSAVVLSKSKALISNDTGLMHMATAVNTPVLAIFGSTVKEFGFYPYRYDSIVVENEGLDCRPCSHIGRDSCPKEHFKCMNEITPEIVIEKFEELIKN
jgi:lipopolysaccharide heptosyltransferase II